MRSRKLLYLFSTVALVASTAHAEVVMLASGTLTGSSAGPNADLSHLTGTLENGLPANILGGIGSGFAYAGGNVFLGVPDRGPNATAYNDGINDTVSFIDRIDAMTITLSPAPAGSDLPFVLTPVLDETVLLWSPTPLVYGDGAAFGVPNGAPAENTADHYYLTGRSDNFDPATNSGNAADARFDPESIRVSNDGRSIFISDEYGPYLYQFDRATGERVRSFELPANLYSDVVSQDGAYEIDNATVGRTANKGMESIAITPDGTMLVGVMQAALVQDAADDASKKVVRIVTIDIASGETHEYAYQLTTGSGVSDIVAINDHQFLVDERDGKGLGDGSNAVVKQFFIIDIDGATEVTDQTGADLAAAAVEKTLFIDLVAVLGDNGVTPDQVPSKIEGLAFGQDVTMDGVTYHTLYVANDNDFLPDEAGPNLFYVLGFTDEDLPGFVPQQIAP